MSEGRPGAGPFSPLTLPVPKGTSRHDGTKSDSGFSGGDEGHRTQIMEQSSRLTDCYRRVISYLTSLEPSPGATHQMNQTGALSAVMMSKALAANSTERTGSRQPSGLRQGTEPISVVSFPFVGAYLRWDSPGQWRQMKREALRKLNRKANEGQAGFDAEKPN